MSKYIDGIEFITELCCNCGIPFAMTVDFYDRRRKDHKNFYCPKGHGQYYTGKTEEQKLRDQLEREQGRAMMLEEQRDRVSRSYNRMRERVKNGLCPCCNRTFQNLLKHMRSKHPDFGDHQVLKALRDIYGLTQSTVAEEIGISPNYISMYENSRPIPEHAAAAIQDWIQASGE